MAIGSLTLSDKKFNEFVNEAVPHMDSNRVRLGITVANRDVLKNLHDDPAAGTGWLQIWPQSQSDNLRTRTITGLKDTLKEDITELMRDIYKDIPESVLTEEDRNVLRIFERDTIPSDRPAVATAPFVDLKVLDGGRVKFTCRVEKKAKRGSRHQDADFAEVRYTLTSLGAPTPADPLALVNRHDSKKATFTIDFGVPNAGKRLFCFVRWAVTGNAEKSGPWAQVMTTVISD